MTPLQKKRDELADKYYEENSDVFYVDDFKNGFDAMYAEHERIVNKLLYALETVNRA